MPTRSLCFAAGTSHQAGNPRQLLYSSVQVVDMENGQLDHS